MISLDEIRHIGVDITDMVALKRIPRSNIRSYLRRNGWSCSVDAQGSEWYDNGVQTAIVPESDHVVDYANRVYDTILCISEIENRSQLDIYIELMGN